MYLYGAGGHAKVIMDVLRENDIELSGIIDDNPDLREWMGHRVLSSYQQGMSPVLTMYLPINYMLQKFLLHI